jgi:hypothetical protein
VKSLAAAAALTLLPTICVAEKLETTHLFGFTLGSDVNDVGEREAESEGTGRFGKGAGAYTALSQQLAVKFIPFQDFSIEPGVGAAYHDIFGVSGLDDRHQTAFDTVSLEMRYRVLNRERAPFGLTVGTDPHWGRVDDLTGEPVDRYGTDFWIIADKELISDRIFAAFNLFYQPEAIRQRATGIWEHQSQLGTSAAMVLQVHQDVFIGAEARYMRSYDGLGLDVLTGNALFVGPTFYARLSERAWVSAAWNAQVTGRAVNAPSGSLDLANYERYQAKLRFGYNF